MTGATNRAVIVGAGIAGLATALRLEQAGWEPVVIERAPRRRGAGYVVNFYGLGYQAAERLGVLAALRQYHAGAPELDYVKSDGSHHFSVPRTSVEAMLGKRDLTLLRGDIEAALYEAVHDKVKIRFDTTIETVTQDGSGVHVGLSDGGTEDADLLIGADGVHSTVRELVFGPEEQFRRDLNHIVAALPLREMPAGTRAMAITTSIVVGRTLAIANLGTGRNAAFFTYSTPDPGAELAKGPQRAIGDKFGDYDWIVPDLIDQIDDSESVYFDSVCQAIVDRWIDGRVALVGDAAWCVSLFGGYGASLAVAGADQLGAELERRPDDIPAALYAWEASLRPDVERRQQMGRRNTAAHAPTSRFQIHVRNLVLRLISLPPVRNMVARRFQFDG
jgi:2-polyprenyl-6-methoxyphenol hydroxylase-like FAD-dependent oxidoreductase